MLERIQDYTQDPDYEPNVIKRNSKACEVIASWVLAIEKAAILHHTLPQ
jgi:hypothetical protein